MTDRTLVGFRLIETRYGDTLQRVAARELGDAARWYELAEINGLRPPYLTDDQLSVSATVKLTGSQLLVPAATPKATIDSTPDGALGIDILLHKGSIQSENGDIALVSGAANYVQALTSLVVTEPGDLLFHPTYGCGVRSLLGSSNSRAKMMLAGGLVRRAIASDPRTAEVVRADISANGDSLQIEAHAMAVHGQPVRLSQVL